MNTWDWCLYITDGALFPVVFTIALTPAIWMVLYTALRFVFGTNTFIITEYNGSAEVENFAVVLPKITAVMIFFFVISIVEFTHAYKLVMHGEFSWLDLGMINFGVTFLVTTFTFLNLLLGRIRKVFVGPRYDRKTAEEWVYDYM